MTQPTRHNFDLVARPYRWLEYLTLGPALERCRFYFLPHLASRSHVLALGDGDGRFLARLLAANPGLTADVVDSSAAMLALLASRCERHASRLKIHLADAVVFVRDDPPAVAYDVIVTHFFLDCLTQPQVDALTAAIVPQLAPNALWLVSDFRIPAGLMRFPARVLVRSLYLAFRILTGLRPTRLPNHALALTRAGFTRIAHRHSLFGILTTELWAR